MDKDGLASSPSPATSPCGSPGREIQDDDDQCERHSPSAPHERKSDCHLKLLTLSTETAQMSAEEIY